MSATIQRELAINKAKSDSAGALTLARKVSEPWFRAQALAWVARYSPDDRETLRIAREALGAALEGEDGYRRVGASAWAVRALVERGHLGEVRRVLPPLLTEADAIPHPVNRLDALLLLWQAAWPLPKEDREGVQNRLTAACLSARSWKAGRALRWVAEILSGEDPDQAEQWVAALPPGPYKRGAEKVIRAGRAAEPRLFFW